jgi:hypothetical protein
MDTDTVTDTGGSLPVVGNFNKYFDECNTNIIIEPVKFTVPTPSTRTTGMGRNDNLSVSVSYSYYSV